MFCVQRQRKYCHAYNPTNKYEVRIFSDNRSRACILILFLITALFVNV